MKVKLFTVLDSKVQSCEHILEYRTQGEAIRALQDAMENKDSALAKHPEDFTLFQIGEYDKVTGIITAYDAKVSVICLHELKKD